MIPTRRAVLIAVTFVVATAAIPFADSFAQKGEVVPAPPEAYDTLRTAPIDRSMPAPPGVTRTLDLFYQPSVPDSILPLVPVYREVHPEESLTTYIGALRQDSPARPYPVVLNNQTVHVSVDGKEGQSHLAVVLMVPWFGKIGALPMTELTLSAKVDGGPEQKWKLMFTPGPVFYIPGQRPLPVSNPTLVTLPLAPGRHRVELKIKDLEAAYAFLLLGQPRLTPLAVERVHSR
jgi:hypothetical protein